ncbi:MAG: DUF488 domain-containing protein [Ginsengibacter sp.]
MKTIYTIGHSTRSLEEFIKMLNSFEVQILADIRSLPGSNRYPQFNKENLKISMPAAGIQYKHLRDLGGRRKVKKDTRNNRWRSDSFKGYADYMETPEFKIAIENLEQIALKNTTAYMCSEAVWWRCHRSMVSDYLKVEHWKVFHIIAPAKAQEHSFTEPALVVNDTLTYSDDT